MCLEIRHYSQAFLYMIDGPAIGLRIYRKSFVITHSCMPKLNVWGRLLKSRTDCSTAVAHRRKTELYLVVM
jgi:hypothetical protein